MAIMRGGKSAYITEINNNGVATQEELNTHEESFAHAPNAISGIHEGKYLRFVNGEYIWDSVDIDPSQTNIGSLSEFISSLN